MTEIIKDFALRHWTSVVEIAILAVVIYFGYLYFRGTRGARVLTGMVVLFLAFTLVSQILRLEVLSWLIRSLTAFLALALVVIFQPELRRMLAELGSHHFFASASQRRETIELITDAVFQLSHKQFGALIAVERDTNLHVFTESGVLLDCEFSPELVLTIFQPKTALHDGGLIVRSDRIVAAGCVFPVSQREDIDRSLGLRHRAALGISEESDALAVVVSEESGNVSICHRGIIERNFVQESFKRRLGQLLLLEKYERADSEELEGEDRGGASRNDHLVSHQEKR